jgi:hypothetical protein
MTEDEARKEVKGVIFFLDVDFHKAPSLWKSLTFVFCVDTE